MKILLDENVHRKLLIHLFQHEAYTVQQMGMTGYKNFFDEKKKTAYTSVYRSTDAYDGL